MTPTISVCPFRTKRGFISKVDSKEKSEHDVFKNMVVHVITTDILVSSATI